VPSQHVTRVTPGVNVLGRARDFYEALGWRPAEIGEGPVLLHLDGMAPGLFGRTTLATDQGLPEAPPGTGAMAPAQDTGTGLSRPDWHRYRLGGHAPGQRRAAQAATRGVPGRLFGRLCRYRRPCPGTAAYPIQAA